MCVCVCTAGFGTTQTASTGGGLFGGATQQPSAGASLFGQPGGGCKSQVTDCQGSLVVTVSVFSGGWLGSNPDHIMRMT